jgi:hypothetical protein
MISERYRAQVDLLLQVLPYVAKQKSIFPEKTIKILYKEEIVTDG